MIALSGKQLPGLEHRVAEARARHEMIEKAPVERADEVGNRELRGDDRRRPAPQKRRDETLLLARAQVPAAPRQAGAEYP